MSQIHALSDDQVGEELKKMTGFIKQEAIEKAREIQIKADEEFSMEKSRLVLTEKDAIDATYAKKFKQATMSQQITRSTMANKTRLKVLAARQALLDEIFETAENKLADLASKDKQKYGETLKNLLLEGFYALDERELAVRARKADYDLVRTAIEKAAAEFKKTLDRETSASIDEDNPVPEGSAGGVWIVGGAGKIEIDNTFEARLNILKDNALPAVRETLFGKNPNRKFYD